MATAMVSAGLGAIPAAADAASRPVPATHVSPQAAPRAVGSITGVLRGPGGRAADGTCVTATGGGRSITSRIGSTGRYFLVGLRPGPYEVHVALCAAPSVPAVLRDGRTYEMNQGAHVVVQPGRRVTLTSASLNPVRLVIATPGQQRAMQQAAARSSGPGTISGIVRGPSGRPLAGICVTVWAFSANSSQGIGLSTGRNGRYSIEPATAGLPSRGLRVQFTAGVIGCGNKGNYAPQWWKNVSAESKATALTVKAGTHLKNIDAKMTTGGEFSGVVRATSKTGHPLRGICIETIPTSASGFFELPDPAFTAANGTYTVDDLGTGSYAVVAAPGSECGGKSYGNDDYLVAAYPHAVKVVAGRHVNGIDFALRLGGILAGTVTSGGVGAAGVCVDFDENGVPTGQFTTGPGGSFQIEQLTPGRYQLAYTGGCGNTSSLAPQFYPGAVNAEDATTLTLTYGQTRSGLDATMQPGATISGLVTNTLGTPLGQVCIEPDSPQDLGPIPNDLSLFATLTAGAVSGSKGGYFLRNLAPGSYYIVSATCNNANIATQVYAAPGQSQPTLVSAPAGVVTSSIDIVEPKGGTISGVVRNAQGHPLAGMCVDVVPSASTSVSDLTTEEGLTGKSGKYGVNDLATGSYKVEFSSCGLGPYAASWYGGVSFFASAKTVIVKAGHVTSGINGVVRPGQFVSGRVTNATTGAALKNLCVIAVDPQGNPISAGISNAKGIYGVPVLAPGTYTLQFGSCSEELIVSVLASTPAPAGSVSPAASAPAGLAPVSRTVKVTASRPVTGINEALKPGGHITGVVQAGTPAAAQPGVCVEATPVTGNGVASVGVTESGGNYNLGPLAAGTYQLEFTTACSTGTEALVPLQYPTLVTVKPPQTDSAVDATLVSDGGITGTVTNQSSADVAGVCVTAQAAGGTPVEAVTGSSGSYTIPSLTPGSYTVEFSSGCGAKGYVTQWWDDQTSAASATPVPVTAGGTASGIDATLSS